MKAEQFIKRLKAHRSLIELKKYHRYFKFDEGRSGKGDRFIGVRMGRSYKVVRSYLFDFGKPRDILYTLAHSTDTWERRTAIVSTLYFIGKGDVVDAFKIAEMLLKDDQDLVHKGTEWALRYAGQKRSKKAVKFFRQTYRHHAACRPALRD